MMTLYKSTVVNRLLLALAILLPLSCGRTAEPQVILDTDIDSDVDDVQALAMAHTLASRGLITLLGVIVTSDDPFAPTCVSALNQYFGRPNLPIGFLKNQGELRNHSRYTRQISEEFPRQLSGHEQAPDATGVYRRLLSESADRSVVIVTIGHLTNLQNLLRSPPDRYSRLDGTALAAQKVRRWICMGGMFPRGKEANFYRPDPLSTVNCIREWPGPVTFCGWEVGNLIQTGGAYLKASLPVDSPVRRAYQLFNDFRGRASWDQVAVLMLTADGARFFDTVGGGHCHVEDDGSNEWRTDRVRAHDYVVLRPGVPPDDVARLMDDLSRRE
jgi:purine nucleosidase